MTPPAKTTKDSKVVSIKNAKKATKKATKKKATKKKAITAVDMARAAILKHTKQKPIVASFSTYPHVPSGNVLVDDIIGGSPAGDGKGAVCPGFPRRRITEIYGPAGAGKTTAGLQAIAEVQKQGGNAIFLDFEQAIHHGYARAIGVSFHPSKMLLYAPETLEMGFKQIYLGIMSGVDLIVVDSVAAMTPQKELVRDIEAEDIVGLQARRMSSLLRRVVNWLNHKDALKRNPKGTALVFINQPRADIKSKGGDDHTAGGKALKFYASLRLMYIRLREETLEKKDPLTGKKKKYAFGNHTMVKVVKNKMDLRQGYTANVFIRFGFGIDEFYSIIEAGVNARLIKQEKGGWFHYGGEKWQGREKFRVFLKDNPAVFKEIRDGVLRTVAAGVQEMIPDEDELDDATALEISINEEFGEDEELSMEPENVMLGLDDIGDVEVPDEAEVPDDD